MSTDELEQIRRILEPAIRETVREVLENEFIPFVERIAALERDVAHLKNSQGRLFGIWTFIWTIVVFIVSLISKAIWDFLSAKLHHR